MRTIEDFIKELKNGSNHIPTVFAYSFFDDEDSKQLADLLEELQALRLLLDWAVECGFGLDNFPDEYEKYKHTLNDDMSYTDMIKQIAFCVIKGVRGEEE